MIRLSRASLFAALLVPNQAPTEVEQAIRDLRDPDAYVRADAAERLRHLGEAASPAVPDLTVALRDPDARVRAEAAAALAWAGFEAAASARQLAASTRDTEPAVRSRAAFALGGLAKYVVHVPEYRGAIQDVVGALCGLLTDPLRDVRVNAVSGLGHFGRHAGVCALGVAGLLTDSDDDVRMFAAGTLTAIGSSAGTALPLLERAASNHPDAEIRYRVAVTIASIDAKHQSGIPKLVECLASEDYTIRANAAGSLGELGTKAQSAAPALVRALGDVHPLIRSNAASALGRIGSADAAVVRALKRALRDADGQVQQSASRALEALRKQ